MGVFGEASLLPPVVSTVSPMLLLFLLVVLVVSVGVLGMVGVAEIGMGGLESTARRGFVEGENGVGRVGSQVRAGVEPRRRAVYRMATVRWRGSCAEPCVCLLGGGGEVCVCVFECVWGRRGSHPLCVACVCEKHQGLWNAWAMCSNSQQYTTICSNTQPYTHTHP